MGGNCFAARIHTRGKGEGKRRQAAAAAQFQFVLAELVVIDEEVHLGLLYENVTLFLAVDSSEPSINGGILSAQWFAILKYYDAAGRSPR